MRKAMITMKRMTVERNMCEMCGDRVATVFMVVHDGKTAKAHVYVECFEELRDVPGGTIASVSLQDYRETVADEIE